MTRVGALVVTLICAGALAADSEDIAFFEFLGSFSDDDGEWLDPLTLAEAVADSEITTVSDADAGTDTQDEQQDEQRNQDNDT